MKPDLDHSPGCINTDGTGIVMYNCTVCSESFSDIMQLSDHIGSHGAIPCELCGSMFITKNDLLDHTQEAHRNIVRCYICSTFMDGVNMSLHLQIAHPEEDNICRVRHHKATGHNRYASLICHIDHPYSSKLENGADVMAAVCPPNRLLCEQYSKETNTSLEMPRLDSDSVVSLILHEKDCVVSKKQNTSSEITVPGSLPMIEETDAKSETGNLKQCIVCLEMFHEGLHFELHSKTHRVFACKVCSQVFNLESQVNDHWKEIHSKKSIKRKRTEKDALPNGVSNVFCKMVSSVSDSSKKLNSGHVQKWEQQDHGSSNMDEVAPSHAKIKSKLRAKIIIDLIPQTAPLFIPNSTNNKINYTKLKTLTNKVPLMETAVKVCGKQQQQLLSFGDSIHNLDDLSLQPNIVTVEKVEQEDPGNFCGAQIVPDYHAEDMNYSPCDIHGSHAVDMDFNMSETKEIQESVTSYITSSNPTVPPTAMTISSVLEIIPTDSLSLSSYSHMSAITVGGCDLSSVSVAVGTTQADDICKSIVSHDERITLNTNKHSEVRSPLSITDTVNNDNQPEQTVNEGYTCHQCGQKFDVKSRWKHHIKLIPTDDRFKCGICFKRFCNRIVLNKHKRNHVNESNPLNQEHLQSVRVQPVFIQPVPVKPVLLRPVPTQPVPVQPLPVLPETVQLDAISILDSQVSFNCLPTDHVNELPGVDLNSPRKSDILQALNYDAISMQTDVSCDSTITSSPTTTTNIKFEQSESHNVSNLHNTPQLCENSCKSEFTLIPHGSALVTNRNSENNTNHSADTKQEEQEHDKQDYSCPLCEENISRKRWKQHVDPIRYDVKYRCNMCSKLLCSRRGLNKHKMTHVLPFQSMDSEFIEVMLS